MTDTTALTDTFSTDATGLPTTQPSEVLELADGDTFDLRIGAVANEVGNDVLRMLAYNRSIPGPTLRVRQGSEITVHVQNDGDVEATVHWHGLRLENRYDGVPHETQQPVPVGGDFTYKLRFPDEGLYWYHPHIREDYAMELGLYGNLIVDPSDPHCWPPVDREIVVTLDDLLVVQGRIAPFHRAGPSHTAMGRFGNVMLTGGQTNLALDAQAGQVVRFYLTNTANTRIFDVGIPSARMKLVGGDSGRYEHEEFVDHVLLAPSERAIVDVLFDAEGSFPIEHRTPDQTYVLGGVTVRGHATRRTGTIEFERLRTYGALTVERTRLTSDRERPPDKTLTFRSKMPLLYGSDNTVAAAWTCPMHAEIVRSSAGVCPLCGMKLVPAGEEVAAVHEHHTDAGDGLEWEDLMPEINAQTDACNMIWSIVDEDTGGANGDIDWSFRVGDRVKIRLVNTMDSDHPMHHPFHIHGAGRFLVLSRDGVVEANLVWKDTVLVRSGETVEIVLDVSNRGQWMAHCHIAEHMQDGMMFSFSVYESA